VGQDIAATYEKLRAAVLSAEPLMAPGLGILCHQGVAAWMRALWPDTHTEAASRHGESTRRVSQNPSPPASDVTRLIAGIIVSLALEPIHA
jgi:hypothetical protein